jgi:hypothetical protein
MDSFILEAAKQVPALVVLAWIVNKFIAANSASQTLIKEQASASMQAIKDQSDACHKVQTAIADKTVTALDNNTKAFVRCEVALEKCERKDADAKP